MKLKNVPVRSVIKCIKCKAEALHHGAMGTRINVLEGDTETISLGKQVWSNETDVILTDEIVPVNNKQLNLRE